MEPKLNTRVRLKPDLYCDAPYNPTYGGVYGKVEGTITTINITLSNPYIVLWDNKEVNFYKKDDLILTSNSKQLTLF